MVDYSSRIKTFQKSMNCDYALVVSKEYDSNAYYFTGFKGGSFGFLVIPKKGKPSFISTKLDIGNVQYKEIRKIVIEKSTKEALLKVIKKNKRIGVDFSALTMNFYKGIKKSIKPKKFVDIGQLLIEQRAIKDKYEITQIKDAAKQICDILEQAITNIPKFTHENELRNFIDTEAKRRGLNMSFDTIVASGKNASNPHYSACNQKLSRGFLVIDCGVKVNGYCSDITRTVFLGSPTEKEKENYRKVLDVQLKCIELIKSKSPKEAELFAKKELGDYFVHSLGHGIGLDIHELPGITKNNGKNLANGVCFTIEPGMYKKGKYGIRIEDDLIKENGNVSVITGLTKALISFNTKVYK